MNGACALRVLHLDDEPRQNSVARLRRKLKENRCKVDGAVNLQDAVRLLQKNQYDCVISDLVKGADVAAMEFQEMLDYGQGHACPPTMAVFSAFLGDWAPKRREYWERKGVRLFAKDRVDELVTSLTVNWCHKFRELWRTIPRENLRARTCLAIVHGIVERSSEANLRRAYDWLRDTYEGLRTGAESNAQELEAQARKQNCGLQVFDSQRDPLSATAFFGVIRSVQKGVADISFYVRETSQRPEDPVLEATEVPAVDLPLPYATPGVWVAWVEREYQDGSGVMAKGRFEPASALPPEWDSRGTLSRRRAGK